MAARVSARLTASEGRRFGLTVGAAFCLLGGAWWWRGHESAAVAALMAGTALLLTGTLVPTHLGPVHAAWMRLAHLLSRVTTPLFMGLVYFLILTPMGWMRRTFGRSPLARTAASPTFWVTRDVGARRSDLTRQY